MLQEQSDRGGLMAKIVLGMATPHSGMLGKAPETWLEDGERDRNNNALWFRNRAWTYRSLEKERLDQGFSSPISLEERRSRSARCTKALDVLRKVYQDHRPDVAIII